MLVSKLRTPASINELFESNILDQNIGSHIGVESGQVFRISQFLLRTRWRRTLSVMGITEVMKLTPTAKNMRKVTVPHLPCGSADRMER